jgi:replicative DNA helicase
MEQNTLDVTEQTEVFAFTSIRELVNQTLPVSYDPGRPTTGLSTGFRALDTATGGLQKGQLVTIAVKPGMGKTAFLLSLANNMAIKNDYTLAIFSAERSNQKMISRLIESETGMSLDKIQHGAFKASEMDHMHSLLSSIAKANIFFDDTPSLSIEELEKKCRQLKHVHGVDIIIIDYLELLLTHIMDAESRAEQLNTIVMRIKEIGSELNIPILLFSQLQNTHIGLGSLKPPALNDVPVFLSEHSDVILFVHRSGLAPKNGKSAGRSKVEVIVAKHQEPSRQVSVPMAYIDSIAKFADLS